jgi:hypothetical protein
VGTAAPGCPSSAARSPFACSVSDPRPWKSGASAPRQGPKQREGHDFSRAAKPSTMSPALAAEGMPPQKMPMWSGHSCPLPLRLVLFLLSP